MFCFLGDQFVVSEVKIDLSFLLETDLGKSKARLQHVTLECLRLFVSLPRRLSEGV